MKSLLREKYFSLRKKNYFDLNKKQIDFMLSNITGIIKKTNKKRMGIYYPIKCEINIFSVIANTYLNCNIMLPSLKKNNGKMIFKKWDRTQPLCLGKFGIPEPHSNHVSLEPDILIVPLLAFDKNKNRLGYGGGYYDKYLYESKKKNILSIGLGFSFQKTKCVPTNKYDKKLDYVLTEGELLY